MRGRTRLPAPSVLTLEQNPHATADGAKLGFAACPSTPLSSQTFQHIRCASAIEKGPIPSKRPALNRGHYPLPNPQSGSSTGTDRISSLSLALQSGLSKRKTQPPWREGPAT